MVYITSPKEYYGALARQQSLHSEAAAYRTQAAAIENFLQSDLTYRSQGVAKLQNSVQARASSDPTFAGMVAHDAENRELIEERRQKLHAALRAEQEAAEIELQISPMRIALELLPEIDRQIIEQRYRYRRKWAFIGIETQMSESGLHERTTNTLVMLQQLLDSTAQGKFDSYPDPQSWSVPPKVARARKMLVGSGQTRVSGG